MENVERILSELLSEFNTLKTAPREYKLILDDIISTTSAKYVTESTAGFFTDRNQPAFLCLRACVHLTFAAQATGARQVEMLEKALVDFDKAQWEGIDQNTKDLKPNFLKLRKDKDSLGADEYNHKIAEVRRLSPSVFGALFVSDVIVQYLLHGRFVCKTAS